MKKFVIFVLVILFIAGNSVLLHAKDVAPSDKGDTTAYRLAIGEKAARGTKNILFGWTEIPKRVVDITKETNNPLWGAVAGGFQGILKAMARTFSGVVDVVTAPINPEGAPLMQPDIDVE